MASKNGTAIFLPLAEEMKYAYHTLVSRGAEFTEEFDEKRSEYACDLPIGPARRPLPVSIHVVGDMGNLNVVNSVAPIIWRTSPKTVILVGLAGSMNPKKFGLGDVCISATAKCMYVDKVKELDKKKEVFKSTISMPDKRIEIDDRLKFIDRNFLRIRRSSIEMSGANRQIRDYLTHLKGNALPPGVSGFNDDPPKVDWGTILGTEFVIDSQDLIDLVQDKNRNLDDDYYNQKAVKSGQIEDVEERNKRTNWLASDLDVVDMESFGFLTYVESISRAESIDRAFSVRGISDLASGKSNLDRDSKSAVRELAVKNAVEIAVDLLDYLGEGLIAR